MVTREQIEQAMEEIPQKTLKALSKQLQLSEQGTILALKRTGLRDTYDFKSNHGINLPEPWNKGKKMSKEYRAKLSSLRKGKKILPRSIRTCPECGKEFQVAPDAKSKRINYKYCSSTCKNSAHSKRMSTGVTLETRICEMCGKEVTKMPALFNDHCFCSYKCSSSWKRGKSYEERYGEEKATQIKEKIAITTEERNRNNRPISKLHLRVKEEMNRQGITGFITGSRYSYFELDEYNPEFSLVVEIDGDYWHSSAKKQSQDKRKDSFLANKGLKVLRLKECDINKDISFEVAKIKELINAKVTI